MPRSRSGSEKGRGDFRLRLTTTPSPEQIAREFRRLGDEFDDWKPAWRALAPGLAQGLAANIASRGALIGNRWRPIRPKYARRKARKGWGATDLVVTGRTVAQATSPTEGVISLTKRQVKFGVRSVYARKLQFGRNRWFVGWNDGMQAAAIEAMTMHAESLLRLAAQRMNAAATASGASSGG